MEEEQVSENGLEFHIVGPQWKYDRKLNSCR